MSYSIPESDVPAVKRFLTLSDEQANALSKAIERAAPAPMPSFVEVVIKKSGLNHNTVGDIIRLLLKMYSLHDREQSSVEDFAKTILESFRAIDGIQIKDEAKTFERIKCFLSFERTMGLSMKAASLAMEHDRNFCSAHVFTDVRPVFSNDLSKPEGAVIVHNLNISYHEGKQHREFYVALAPNELKEVADAVSRAMQKDKAMKSLLRKSGLQYFGK